MKELIACNAAMIAFLICPWFEKTPLLDLIFFGAMVIVDLTYFIVSVREKRAKSSKKIQDMEK